MTTETTTTVTRTTTRITTVLIDPGLSSEPGPEPEVRVTSEPAAGGEFPVILSVHKLISIVSLAHLPNKNKIFKHVQ